jgi:hypothetical protein
MFLVSQCAEVFKSMNIANGYSKLQPIFERLVCNAGL